MNKTAVWAMVIFLFLATAVSHLFFAFSTPHLKTLDSYNDFQQVAHIRDTGKPMLKDATGALMPFSPVFHYLIAGIALLLPLDIAIKLVPSLFMSLLVIAVFLLMRNLTRQTSTSLLVAFAAGFVPVIVLQTPSSISPYTLALPLMAFLWYLFLRGTPRAVGAYAVFFIVLTFTHPSVLLFVAGLLFYALLCFCLEHKLTQNEKELILFSTFFALWAEVLLFKNPLLAHGIGVLWQNVPDVLRADYFAKTTVLEAVFQLGIVPVIVAVWTAYRAVFRKKKEALLFVSFGVILSILLWLRLIPPVTGFLIISIAILPLFGLGFKSIRGMLVRSRAGIYVPWLVLVIVLLFFFTSIFPLLSVVSSSQISDADIQALSWLRENSPESATVIAYPEDAAIISLFAGRKPLLSSYLLISDAEQKYSDIVTTFTSQSEINAITVHRRYNATYIFLSERARQAFDLDDLPYSNQSICIAPVYKGPPTIYVSQCRLEERK